MVETLKPTTTYIEGGSQPSQKWGPLIQDNLVAQLRQFIGGSQPPYPSANDSRSHGVSSATDLSPVGAVSPAPAAPMRTIRMSDSFPAHRYTTPSRVTGTSNAT